MPLVIGAQSAPPNNDSGSKPPIVVRLVRMIGGALWAPMTNGMIFGLIVSTGLTLFVIPSLYVFMVEKAGMSVPGLSSQTTVGQA